DLHPDDPVSNSARRAKRSLRVYRGDAADCSLRSIPGIERQELIVLQKRMLELPESDAGLNVNGQVRRIVFSEPAEPRKTDRAVRAPQRIAELGLRARAQRNDRALFR